MKRSKKLICLLAVLVVLIGAGIAATKLNPENQPVEEEPAVAVFSLTPEEVTQIGWDYSEAVSFTADEDGWVYDDDPSFPLDEAYIDAMLETLTEITADKTIEAVEDLDQYGLEVPVCSITVTTDTTYTLAIGEETEMGGQRYFSTGDGNVYLVDSGIIDSFSYGLYDVLAYESIPAMSDVTGFALESDTQSYAIEYLGDSGLAYSEEYVWFMGDKPLDTDFTNTLISTVTSLSWVDCADYNASDLSQYGLDAPAATATVYYTQQVQVETSEVDEDGEPVYETQTMSSVFTLELGDYTGEYCYARIAGSNMVYRVDASVSDTLLYTTYYSLQPDEVLLMDWDEVTEMDITLDGQTYTFTRETKTVTDEDGNTSEETVYLLLGEEVGITSITNALDSIEAVGYATGLTPDRSEEISIVIHREDENYPEVTLAFYQYDSSSCMTTLNGEATLFASREDVVALIETVNTLVLG